MSEQKTLDEVYHDRNLLALAFAEAVRYLQLERPGSCQYRAGWRPDRGDDADAGEWAIVQVRLPTGQVSWHVPRELVEETDLPPATEQWDGHSRKEKNERLSEYLGR